MHVGDYHPGLPGCFLQAAMTPSPVLFFPLSLFRRPGHSKTAFEQVIPHEIIINLEVYRT